MIRSNGHGPPAVLDVDGVDFRYGGGPPVLTKLRLTVEAGQSVAIMGSSGAGKSTLLQLLSGVIAPSAGRISLLGEPFSELRPPRRADLRLRHLGLVFQFGELVPELSVGENVEIPGLFMGCTRDEARLSAAQALRAVGVDELIDRFPDQISGGQQQRVAIARALVNNPALVLADEPTGALDDSNAERVLDLLLTVPRRQNGAVVIVTHATAVADRCDVQLQLSNGRLSEFRPAR